MTGEPKGGDRKRSYAAPALEKGIEIVELLASAPAGLTVSEMAQRLGRSIGEIFRIVIVMEARNWLRKGPKDDRYTVTYRVLEAAFRATPAHGLTMAAAVPMQELTDAINLSCHLVVVGDGCGLVVKRQESPGHVGFGVRLGVSVDLVTSCSGHVLLAFMPEAQREALVAELTGSNPAAQATLRQRIATVRAQGYEMQPSARVAGVTDLSAPIFGFEGHAVAALTVPYLVMIDGCQPTDLNQTRDRLRETAERISADLGWVPATAG